jgi:ribosomal protein L4
MINLISNYTSSNKDIRSVMLFLRNLKEEIDKKLLRLTIFSTLSSTISFISLVILVTNYLLESVDKKLVIACIIMLPTTVIITLEIKNKTYRLRSLLSVVNRYEKKLNLYITEGDDAKMIAIHSLISNLARKIHATTLEVSRAINDGNTQLFLHKI